MTSALVLTVVLAAAAAVVLLAIPVIIICLLLNPGALAALVLLMLFSLFPVLRRLEPWMRQAQTMFDDLAGGATSMATALDGTADFLAEHSVRLNIPIPANELVLQDYSVPWSLAKRVANTVQPLSRAADSLDKNAPWARGTPPVDAVTALRSAADAAGKVATHAAAISALLGTIADSMAFA